MNVHKVTLCIVDFDNLGADEIKSTLENERFPNDCISLEVVEIETRDIGTWSDSHPLNKIERKAEFEKIFKK